MLPEMHRYVIKVEKLSSIFETVLIDRAGTRRAPGPARAGTRPCWWSASGTATPAAGSVYFPGTWSAFARAPCPETATGTGSASCCVCCSWCVWSGTSSGSETGPSFRATLGLTAGFGPRTCPAVLASASGSGLAILSRLGEGELSAS